MPCYFAFLSKNKNQLVLDQEDSNHIVKVLRHKINDEIIVGFQKRKYLTKIISLAPQVVCQIISVLEINSELPIKVTLVVGLLKEQKFDLVIQKAVELGVYQIVPIQLERSVSVVTTNNIKKFNHKLIRWQSIAKSAAKQASRNFIPKVMPVVSSVQNLKAYLSEVNFLAYENTEIKNWSLALQGKKSVTIVVGPEGGISETELQLFANLNFTNISLGKTILRAETAGLYFLSVVNFYTVINN